MRPADSILEEIRDLDETLAAFGGEILGDDSGDALMQRSLLARKEELVGLLAAALVGLQQPGLRLYLDGGPVSGKTIAAGFLGRALEELQGSLHALGASLLGRVGERGLLTSRAVEETQFLVTGIVPGSFGVVLEAPLGPIQQSMLTEETDLSLAERATSRLIDLLEIGSTAETNDALVEALGDLGLRPVNRLRGFADLMRDSEATVRLEWQSPDVPERDLEMDRGQIRRLAGHLASVEAREETITVRGWLGGASKIRGRFELEVDGRLYSGAAAPDVIESVEKYFNRRCEADLVVTVTRSLTSGKEFQRYYLVGLRLASQA